MCGTGKLKICQYINVIVYNLYLLFSITLILHAFSFITKVSNCYRGTVSFTRTSIQMFYQIQIIYSDYSCLKVSSFFTVVQIIRFTSFRVIFGSFLLFYV